MRARPRGGASSANAIGGAKSASHDEYRIKFIPSYQPAPIDGAIRMPEGFPLRNSLATEPLAE